MEIFIILTLILSSIFIISKRNNYIQYIQLIIIISLFFSITLGIKYTADWNAYELLYNDANPKIDFGYAYLSKLFKEFGLKFHHLYQFHIILSTLFLLNFIKKFSNNIFLIFVFFSFICFIPFINQIRYFLSLTIFFNACYYFYIKRNKSLSIFLFVISFICHSSIVLLLLFLVINRFITIKKYLITCLLICIGLGIFSSLLDFISSFTFFSKYLYYLKTENVSSILGGIYNVLPYCIVITYVILKSKKDVKKYPELLNDDRYKLLYKMSIYSIIFILISLNFQIIAHRYVIPFSFIWICLYLYPYQFANKRVTYIKKGLNSIVILLFLVFYTYNLSEYVLKKESNVLIEFNKSIESIKY